MKLIHVYGTEDDYAADDFNLMSISYEKAYKLALEKEDGIWEFRKGAFVKAMDFAYVHTTDDFIDFIKEVLGDKDLMKSEDFFVVED